jgi:hypothetical protein
MDAGDGPRRGEPSRITLGDEDESGVIQCSHVGPAEALALFGGIVLLAIVGVPAQAPDAASVIHTVDAAVAARVDRVVAFTDTERYSIYRGGDETHPAAEMTATDAYTKGVGKSYTIVSLSGSSIIQRVGLKPLIDNEEKINLPGKVETSWFVSANYEMSLRPGPPVVVNGRSCHVLDIKAKHKAPNMIDGSMWVDVRDGSLVQIDGVATQSASIYSGPAHMTREYVNVDGFAMATHARAESNSFLFGRTVVTVDYSNYHLQIKPAK